MIHCTYVCVCVWGLCACGCTVHMYTVCGICMCTVVCQYMCVCVLVCVCFVCVLCVCVSCVCFVCMCVHGVCVYTWRVCAWYVCAWCMCACVYVCVCGVCVYTLLLLHLPVPTIPTHPHIPTLTYLCTGVHAYHPVSAHRDGTHEGGVGDSCQQAPSPQALSADQHRASGCRDCWEELRHIPS